MEENSNRGLIPILTKRLGIIKKLSRYTSKHNLKIFIEGILMSKMRYSLPVMINIWHKEIYRAKERKYQCFTKKDLQRLQMIQNTALRILTEDKNRKMPTTTLLKETDSLSVHQIGAQAILNEAKKILITEKPEYMKDLIKLEETRRGEIKVKSGIGIGNAYDEERRGQVGY